MSSWAVASRLEPLEPRQLASVATTQLPRPDHVVVVIEENHSNAHIIGSADTPYINSLAQQGASFTDYHAVTHPSQPNYLALFSGSTQGVIDDTVPHRFAAPSLGGQLIKAGFDFGGYSEDLPYTGYPGPRYRDYRRKHNPWSDFTDVSAWDNMSMRRFPAPGHYDDLPEVAFVVPNQLHDMHTGTIRQGDDWLRQQLDPYAQWAKTHNSLLAVTWDEDDATESNRIPTLVVGQGVEPGAYPQPLNHYSLLRTLEDMYGLSRLGAAEQAAPMDMIWSPPEARTTRLAPTADTYVFDGSPTSNYGRSAVLDVKTSVAGVNRDAYFKFDVSAFPLDGLGAVKLRFNAALSTVGRVATSVFAAADVGWSETGITWNNRPALGRSLGTVTAAAILPLWYEVDVTDYLREQRAAGHGVVTLALHNPQNSTAKLRVNSREAATDRPELVVVRP
jgi:acid phosphatase